MKWWRFDWSATVSARAPLRRRLGPLALTIALLALPAGAPSAIMAQPASAQPAAQPILAAATTGDVAALRKLLAAGAPLDPVDAAGRTPLLLAVTHDRLAAAKLLIEAGANINAVAANRDTPWLLAGARGRTAMLRLMATKGPDLALRNRYGGTALIPACHYGHVDTVNDLGWTCLLEAVILGDGGPSHVAIVRRVLAAGANPNIADRDGVTSLVHARRRGQREVAALIAAAGGK